MKGKLQSLRKKKTIILVLVILVLLVAAITGVTIFLKDDGSASAAMNEADKENTTSTSNTEQSGEQTNEQTQQAVAGDNTESATSTENNEQATSQENDNTEGNGEINSQTTSSQTSNSSSGSLTTQNTTNNTQSNDIQPQEYYVYRDKLVAEDFLVGWTPIAISAITNTTERNLYTPELVTIKNSYTEADIIEENGKIIFPEQTKYTYARPGERIFYEIKVSNVGNLDLENIKVYDTVPENTTLVDVANNAKVEENKITWQIDIPSKTEVTLRFVVRVNEGTIGTIRNVAISDGEETNETQNPVITYEKSVKQTEPLVEGDTIDYTITVKNTGDVDTIVKEVSDTIPEGTTYVENSANKNAIYENGKLIWKDLELAKDSKIELTFQVKIEELEEGVYNKTIPNVAIVDEDETNEVDTEVVKPHITRKKANEPTAETNLHEGDTIKYTITAGNDGTEAKTINIEDAAPEGTTLKDIITEGGEKVGEDGVKWTVTINPNETKTFEFTVTVNTLPEGKYTLSIPNTAIVDEEETNTVKNNVVKPHITKRKESTPKSGSTVKYNEEITYKIIVENDGSESKQVVITDEIPQYTTFVSVQNDGEQIKDASGNTTGVKWTKTVPAKTGSTNGKVEVTFKVKVTGNVANEIINIAKVDNSETNETKHVIEKDITVISNDYTGKNIVVVLDLSSSMLQVKKKNLTSSQYDTKAYKDKGAEEYIYPYNKSNSAELSNSKLAKAKKAINEFAEEVLKDGRNTISLITFNYSSTEDAITGLTYCDSPSKDGGYGTGYLSDWKANPEIDNYVGTTKLKDVKKMTTASEVSTEINAIKIRSPYLLTNIVKALDTTDKYVTQLKKSEPNKEVEVVFIGDGKPSYNTEPAAKPNASGESCGFYSKTKTMEKISTISSSIRKNANLYTIEYGVPTSEKEDANTAFTKMTNQTTNVNNEYRHIADETNILQELINVANKFNEPETKTFTTNAKGIVEVALPTNIQLAIDLKPVTLTVTGEKEKTFNSIAKINEYFATTGRIKFENNKFIIDATKFSADSSITLKYYYTTR